MRSAAAASLLGCSDGAARPPRRALGQNAAPAVPLQTAFGLAKPSRGMRSPFDLLAFLLALAAIFGWLNHRLLRLPMTVGLLLLALVAAILLIAVDAAVPGLGLKPAIRIVLDRVDFPSTLLNG